MSTIDEKRWLHLGRAVFLVIISLLPILVIESSEAQGRLSFKGRPVLRPDGQGACWRSYDLGLTEEQTKTLEALQHDYMAEAWPLRRELLPLMFELRHLIRDPNVQSKVLFDRQKKISELQVKLDNLSLSYQIKVRSILTKEQLEQLPQDCSLGISPEYEILTGNQ